MAGYRCNILAFVANSVFEVISVMEYVYSTRRHCICDFSLEEFSSKCSSEKYVIFMVKKSKEYMEKIYGKVILSLSEYGNPE